MTKIYMVNPVGQIEQECTWKESTQKGVALTYAFALKSWADKQEEIDWKRANDAIIARWGVKALARVKKRAWDIYEGRIRP